MPRRLKPRLFIGHGMSGLKPRPISEAKARATTTKGKGNGKGNGKVNDNSSGNGKGRTQWTVRLTRRTPRDCECLRPTHPDEAGMDGAPGILGWLIGERE